jgi:hypothetical protein
MFWADFVDRARTDNHRIYRRAQQTHNEAVCMIRTADRCTAGLAWDLIAHHTVDRRNKIAYDVRPLVGNVWKMQITAVEFAEIRRKQRFTVNGAIKQSSYRLYHWIRQPRQSNRHDGQS